MGETRRRRRLDLRANSETLDFLIRTCRRMFSFLRVRNAVKEKKALANKFCYFKSLLWQLFQLIVGGSSAGFAASAKFNHA